MGQYYNPAILADNKTTVKKWVYSHDFGNGLKLMEHSYIGNNFVTAFESLILNNPQRVVWAGDYADICKKRKTNVYDRCLDSKQLEATNAIDEFINNTSVRDTRFIINHSKKEFVDKNKVAEINGWEGAKIHPLPLLTCEGNGRGGGDFRGNNKYVGTWARDIISVSANKPTGKFVEIYPNFKE
jgi:hypothetical protein